MGYAGNLTTPRRPDNCPVRHQGSLLSRSLETMKCAGTNHCHVNPLRARCAQRIDNYSLIVRWPRPQPGEQ